MNILWQALGNFFAELHHHHTISQIRSAADTLEWLSRLYGWGDPARGEWSANQLRQTGEQLKVKLFGGDLIVTPPELSGDRNVQEGIELDEEQAATGYHVRAITRDWQTKYWRIDAQERILLPD